MIVCMRFIPRGFSGKQPMLKSRDPVRWRDAWQIEGAIGRYIISDRPMTKEEWVRERAVMIDVTPKKPDAHLGGAIMPMPGVVQVTRWHSTDSFNYDAATEARKLQPPKRQRPTALSDPAGCCPYP